MVNKISKNEGVCKRCHSEVESDDLRCPLCGMATPVICVHTEKIVGEILRCDGCGAGLRYNVKARAPKCAFCGEVMRLEKTDDPLVDIEKYLPFLVTPEEAEKTFRRWIGNLGWFRPSDLKERAGVDNIHALWWVSWVVDAEVLCSWTADTNHDTRRARWAPAAGQDSIHYNNLIISASKGLTFKETYQLIPSYNLSSAKATAQGPDRAEEESFELKRSAARHLVASIVSNASNNRLKRDSIPGSRHRNIHTALLLQKLQTLRLALPAYILAYKYNGKSYRVIISGQEAQNIFGEAPYSWQKILLVIALSIFGVIGLIGFLMIIAAIAAHA